MRSSPANSASTAPKVPPHVRPDAGCHIADAPRRALNPTASNLPAGSLHQVPLGVVGERPQHIAQSWLTSLKTSKVRPENTCPW